MYPILAIDFGKKHIGCAISDSKGLVCSPLPRINVFKGTKEGDLISEIQKICGEYKVKSILIGYPQAVDDNHENNKNRIDAFISMILSPLSLPIIKWDESFSTKGAEDVLISQGRNYKRSKKNIDSIAASVFLEEYLNSRKS
ncbi:Holliday junction resolvase RuvX [Candidatus Dojkabacteria bacterium]|jgi:putative Holliday junction resolvase|nr:Holliday junction resolvase RuvX [Candidatus Dojkabacteria bacterium]